MCFVCFACWDNLSLHQALHTLGALLGATGYGEGFFNTLVRSSPTRLQLKPQIFSATTKKANTLLLVQVLSSTQALPSQRCSCHPMCQVDSCPRFQQFCCQKPPLSPCHLRQVLRLLKQTPRLMQARLAVSCCGQVVTSLNCWRDAGRHLPQLSCTHYCLLGPPCLSRQVVRYSTVTVKQATPMVPPQGGAEEDAHRVFLEEFGRLVSGVLTKQCLHNPQTAEVYV